ncbi:uncharacterized protein BCR38DRAFT_41633 [Pseudomassariella vexata]|uniref:Uncharacterized protein n=1 Tax=Pseudomassariella vexata TaxID=1141098 RepID=A0A1Y2DPI3_9PEZI|nr:uncharacterized protein BCR38DRAFT_41633 [Pseudomassariella vexata]ORY60575.1 hypothetical protein BCR38DRAFT_41633 [Pseudomassariella vexata]
MARFPGHQGFRDGRSVYVKEASHGSLRDTAHNCRYHGRPLDLSILTARPMISHYLLRKFGAKCANFRVGGHFPVCKLVQDAEAYRGASRKSIESPTGQDGQLCDEWEKPDIFDDIRECTQFIISHLKWAIDQEPRKTALGGYFDPSAFGESFSDETHID